MQEALSVTRFEGKRGPQPDQWERFRKAIKCLLHVVMTLVKSVAARNEVIHDPVLDAKMFSLLAVGRESAYTHPTPVTCHFIIS